MQKIIHALLFGVSVVLFSATFAASNPKDIIKKGTNLVYDVNYYGTNYEFTVTVKDNSNEYSFDWYMSAPINKKGTGDCPFFPHFCDSN